MKPAGSAVYGRFAEVYDKAYAFVDYTSGARYISEAIRARHPSARSLLEVACGTGRYLELLSADFEVEGLDRSPEMLEKAALRVPGVPLRHGDMTSFDLGRQFDVVCCLFRSIGYTKTRTSLTSALMAMAAHLTPRGLLLVEPFFTPETYWTDRVTLNHHTSDDAALAWMYVSERDGQLARLKIHTLSGTSAGVEHFVEVHEFGLFTREDFTTAFEAAGLDIEYDPVGPAGIGLYIGRGR